MEPLAPNSVDSFVADAVSRCRSVEQRARLLGQQEFASPNPSLLATLIARMAKALSVELIALRGDYTDDPANALIQIRFLDHFAKELGAHLRYIDGAKTTSLPWSITKPLESLLARFVAQRTVMLRPQWKYNYTISTGDLGEYYREHLVPILSATALDQLFTGFPRGFHIVSFPSIERKSALLHCDLAHELGHLIAEDYIRQESTEFVGLLSERVREHLTRLNESRTPKLEPLFLQVEVSEHIDRALQVRRRALEELVSDMFACKLLGPAALFALHAVAMSFPLDLLPVSRSAYYPPWRMRLRLAIRVIAKAGLLPSQNSTGHTFSSMDQLQDRTAAVLDELNTAVAATSDVAKISSDWLVSLAYESVERALPMAEAFVDGEHGAKFMFAERLYAESYGLVDRLIEQIPPNETGSGEETQPASLEAILNAAWFYRIAFMPAPFEAGEIAEEFLEELETLNRLTLKAAEFAHLRTEYEAWTERNAGLE